MDSIDYLAENDRGAESPVPLTIVRASEGVRNNKDIGLMECDNILARMNLEQYIYSLIK